MANHEYEMKYGHSDDIIYVRFVCNRCLYKGPYWSLWEVACKDLEHHYTLCNP